MDKVQKIREEVVRLKSQLLRGACSSQIAMETMCKEEAYNEVLAILDTVQEEPVSEDLEEAAENAIEDLEQKLTNVTLDEVVRNWLRCMFRAGALWQKEVFEKNRLAACDKQTEEEAEIESDFVTGIIENEHRQPTFDDAIKYGMRLKDKEMQSTIELAEDHAMLAGMGKMKEEMMADAIDVEVNVDAGGYPFIPQMELYDYDKDVPLAKEGDKYKVILIKKG